MKTVLHSAPKFASNEGVLSALTKALGKQVVAAREEHGEVVIQVARGSVVDSLRLLRDEHEYQQLMEIAGVDYPDRAERFEVVYCLLSLTKNHRIIVKVRAAENTPVPTVTTLWPVAGWLEREVFDLYGVVFDGNPDLRRILTDYGFEGHPFRKDFPLTGYVELRYSEEDKRVVYEPVQLAQDLRQFDFMSPWEGADYVLPGDEKAAPAPAAPPPPPAAKPEVSPPAAAPTPKTTDKPSQTGAGKAANKAAAKRRSAGSPAQARTATAEPAAPAPTESRPAKKPRSTKSQGTEPAPRKRRTKGDEA